MTVLLSVDVKLSYFLQEHVRKSVVQIVERKETTKRISDKQSGAIFDTEYAIHAASSLAQSLPTFKAINSELKTAIHLSQQIEHDQKVHRAQHQF